ncbi:MAG: CAP domain-containing protein [Deltaproteobacteria bacterium]|nr:CAP domain-containing protein [Deltaproteobacteria bacterium]
MPSTHNRACRYVTLFAMLTNAVGCAGAAPVHSIAPGRHVAPPSPDAPSTRDCPTSAIRSVVAGVNAARRRARLRVLVADPRLARAAYARAKTMAARNRLSHSGWESVVRGDDAVDGSIGENVAYNYPTAEAVMRGWLASPGHRANILHASFHRIGVGCIVDASGTRWWTQDFAD